MKTITLRVLAPDDESDAIELLSDDSETALLKYLSARGGTLIALEFRPSTDAELREAGIEPEGD